MGTLVVSLSKVMSTISVSEWVSYGTFHQLKKKLFSNRTLNKQGNLRRSSNGKGNSYENFMQ